MRKMIWFTTATILFFVFLLPGILGLFIKYIPYNYQPSLDGVRGIYGPFSVSQVFTSQDSNLTGIGMTIKNPNLKNKSQFYFRLFDESGRVVRQVAYSGANVEDGSYVKFLFDPLVDSKGKSYKFTLENPSAGEEELLGIYYTNSKPSWIGAAMYGDETVEGGVSLVTYHKPPGKLAVVKDLYSNLLSRFLHLNSQKTM